MTNFLSLPVILVSLVPILILVSLALNYPRARRWDQKVRSHGHVTCKECGFVGDLVVRSMTAGDGSSSNLRLVCGNCNGSNWTIPEAAVKN